MKYKLIKTYPGSPKLGTILTHEELQYCNWNEYYQEVVEKDYEILSVITNNNKFIEKVYNQDATIEPYWKIHSVKRKDGEIFTIGDIVTNKGEIINEFEIIDNKLKVWFIHPSYSCPSKPKNNRSITGCGNMNFNWLKNIVKIKQPLFTTEDGVDIYEGDYSYGVHNSKFDIVKIKHISTVYVGDNFIEFSTKEKAEEYILLNKPCLSYNEVLKAVSIKNKNTFETLKILVKSKIQQSV